MLVKGRNLILSMVALLAVSSLLFIPSADGSTYAQPDDITVSPSKNNISLNAGDSVVVYLDIHNKFTRDVAVYVYYTDGDPDITVKFPGENGHRILIGPGEMGFCVLDINVSKYARSTEHDIMFDITINDPERGEPIDADASHSLIISVTSELSSGKSYNKIMGVIDNNLPAPLNSPLSSTIITLAIWVLIAIAVAYILIPILMDAGKKVEDDAKVEEEKIKERWNE